jgi:hypothetical protein
VLATNAFTKVNCAFTVVEVLKHSNALLNDSALFESIKPSTKMFELSTENNFDLL